MQCVNKGLQISFLLALIYGVFPEDIGFLGCTDVQVIDYLNVEKVKGTWYVYQRTPSSPLAHVRCTTIEFDLPIKGEWPAVRYEIERDIFGNENQNKYTYNLTLKGSGKGSTPDFFDYTILDIDYEKYAVVYKCQNLQIAKRYAITVWTRDRFPSSDIVLKAFEIISKNNLSMDNVKKVNQTNCPNKWNAEEQGSGILDLMGI